MAANWCGCGTVKKYEVLYWWRAAASESRIDPVRKCGQERETLALARWRWAPGCGCCFWSGRGSVEAGGVAGQARGVWVVVQW